MHELQGGRGEMYDHFGACGVDPRNIAQRVMDVRDKFFFLAKSTLH